MPFAICQTRKKLHTLLYFNILLLYYTILYYSYYSAILSAIFTAVIPMNVTTTTTTYEESRFTHRAFGLTWLAIPTKVTNVQVRASSQNDAIKATWAMSKSYTRMTKNWLRMSQALPQLQYIQIYSIYVTMIIVSGATKRKEILNFGTPTSNKVENQSFETSL